MECIQMELGEPDDSGRRRPIPKPGTEFRLDVDTVIYALGTTANPIIAQTTPGLRTNKWGYLEVDPETQMTSLPGVFAGGDIVTGSATVIQAMGAGRRAARGILRYLGIETEPEPVAASTSASSPKSPSASSTK
jgi:glutamate synthase (NADPH/NADH) small chain